MAKTKANEREFAGQVIHWIQEQLKEGGLPFENVTNDSGLYGLPTVKFPDVLLTLDFEGLRPFCGWELKTPKTDARDKELLKDAVQKAQIIGAKLFVTWNMQTAIIWKTPEKTRATVNEDNKVREYDTDTQITKVEDIRDRQKADCLRERCREIVSDLGRLYEEEKINIPVADATVWVGMVAAASEKMASSLLADINRARANREFAKRLNAWAAKQGVSKYDQDYWQTLSQQIAYKIIGKILFYITLGRWNHNLPKMALKGDNYKAAMKSMRAKFQSALEVDYQAIFQSDITDEIELSRDTAEVVIDLTDKLTHWSFEQVPLDVVGNVLEKLVPEDARHSLGQYFTPDRLADLVIAFCVNNGDANVMDPTCGTGTFLIRSYDRLRHLGAKRQAHHELLNQIWGFDIAGFPAELATINLCRQDLSDYLNFPRVLSKDFFDVSPGEEFEFPPAKKTIKAGERMRVKIPKFDALVGNFPFIRQEKIEKAEPGYKDKLAQALYRNWKTEYCELFTNVDKQGRVELALSGQADIYAYMFFHAAAHLKPGGRMGFITGNSWLDVAYGYELQKFFLSKFKLVGIFESRCEPWFEQSSYNTVFTILERCDEREEREKNPVCFVKVKKPLEQLFPQDALTDAQARWDAISRFAERIEELGISAENLGKTGFSKLERRERFKKYERINAEYVKQPEIVSYEDDEVRVRIIKQKDLKEDVETTGHTVKWGQYLHGPDIYFEILGKCAGKLVPLSKIAHLRYGVKTGLNKFFYLRESDAKHWMLEDTFLRPVVSSTKEVPRIFIDEDRLMWKAFVCDKAKKEIGGTNALRYIREAERKGWSNVPSVRSRPQWWSLPKQHGADFLVLQFIGKRHYSPINNIGALVGNVVFVGEFKKKQDSDFGGAVMNSSLIALSSEVYGRMNLGDGLLTIYGPDMDGLLLPILKGAEREKEKEAAMEAFRKIGRRAILPFEQEHKQKDRQEFEKHLFRWFGLNEKDYEKVRAAVEEMIEERHLLPKMRTVQKKKRIEQDLVKLKEEVTEEVLPSGVKGFPDAFVKAGIKTEWEEIGIGAEKIKLGEKGLGVQEICDAEGNHLTEVRSIEKAKYIVYAKQKDEQIVKVPNSEIVIKKAVKDYEIYARQIKEELYRAFMEKCGDHNMSENLTRQVCEEFGLPDLSSQ
jgi:type I restriction-modification system DNA methylase subunit